MLKPLLLTVLGCSALIGLSACGNDAPGRSGKTVSVGTADIGGPFTLVETTGDVVTEADLLGKPHLVYFGFAYCPDICPTALQKMGAAQELLGKQGDEIGYVLITVDPERDTPESLGQYITADVFPKGLRGFTGTVEQIEVAKQAYKVTAMKADMPGSAADYTINHSDIMYLMDQDGKFVDYFYGRSTPQDIAVRTRLHLKSGK
ncbi:SCO family protein [Litorimonas sp. RW-G-Af-16]|uniref:SCO family protein n=1 Tax=Litorimonas sp. RW-G-Af-16 TaxID=3241168 RepID=UPI00390C9D89